MAKGSRWRQAAMQLGYVRSNLDLDFPWPQTVLCAQLTADATSYITNVRQRAGNGGRIALRVAGMQVVQEVTGWTIHTPHFPYGWDVVPDLPELPW